MMAAKRPDYLMNLLRTRQPDIFADGYCLPAKEWLESGP